MTTGSTKVPKSRKKNFSSFSYADAFKQLQLTDLLLWELAVPPVEPNAFFQERLHRLEQSFDLEGYEELLVSLFFRHLVSA